MIVPRCTHGDLYASVCLSVAVLISHALFFSDGPFGGFLAVILGDRNLEASSLHLLARFFSAGSVWSCHICAR